LINTATSGPSVDVEEAKDLYRKMKLIRTTEDAIAECIQRKEIGCPCHLYSGEEAVAVGVSAHLKNEDWVYSSHRSHGHFLAKGGDLNALMREVFCREGGCSKGRGGSMHLSQPEVGFPGSSAIVSGSISLAVGTALAFRLRGTRNVAVSYFGDGSADEGVFYESLNLAALYRLPVLFVCENNLYSTHMPLIKCLACTDIAGKAVAMGVKAIKVDGNDVLAMREAAQEAIANMRDGGGPMLLECMTYRHRGHVGPNLDLDKRLRTKEEYQEWLDKDPLKRLRDHMLEKGLATEEWFADADRSVTDLVKVSVEDARSNPWPEGTELGSPFKEGRR